MGDCSMRLFRGVWRCWPPFAATAVVLGPVFGANALWGGNAACFVLLGQMALLFGFVFWEMGE